MFFWITALECERTQRPRSPQRCGPESFPLSCFEAQSNVCENTLGTVAYTKGNIFNRAVQGHCWLWAEASLWPTRGLPWEIGWMDTWARGTNGHHIGFLRLRHSRLLHSAFTSQGTFQRYCHHFSSIYLFNKYSLSIYHVPSTVLDTWSYSIDQKNTECKNKNTKLYAIEISVKNRKMSFWTSPGPRPVSVWAVILCCHKITKIYITLDSLLQKC